MKKSKTLWKVEIKQILKQIKEASLYSFVMFGGES